MWNPVVPSLTVSTRPPVEDTTGTVPYCMACSWIRPQGSNLQEKKREGQHRSNHGLHAACAGRGPCAGNAAETQQRGPIFWLGELTGNRSLVTAQCADMPASRYGVAFGHTLRGLTTSIEQAM
jgi:hypothetical protein